MLNLHGCKNISSMKLPSTKLILLWLLTLALSVGLGLASIIYHWYVLSIHFAGADVFICIYPPLIFCTLWVIWMGFWWGFVPAYIATLVLALYSGMSLPWAMIFAFADPIGLAIFALAYRSISIDYRLNSIKSILFYIGLSFSAAILGSTGSLIWSHYQSSEVQAVYSLWQGWWLGALLQNIFVVGPILYVLSARVERWKANNDCGKEALKSVGFSLVVAGVILLSILGYIFLTIYLSNMSVDSVEVKDLESVKNIIDFQTESIRSVYWVFVAILCFIFFFGQQLFMSWRDKLERSAVELKNSNRLLLKEISERELLNRSLDDLVNQRTSELAVAKDQAEASNKAKSQFLACMSHEIRTPMNAVLGVTDILLNSELDRTQKRQLETIRSSGKTLVMLIDDILDLSKTESGLLELNTHSVQVKPLISSICAPYEYLRTDEIEFTYSVSDDVPEYLDTDDLRLTQIVRNLLSNAFKFTIRGQVSLDITVLEKNIDRNLVILKFNITDSGEGIEQDKQDLLFSAFVQADQSITRRHGGTGLGLAISKQLVELMGGELSVNSKLGQGACFTFTAECPIAVAPEKIHPGSFSADLSALPQFSVRVLLVDDNKVNRYVACSFLKRLGINPVEAENGQQAVDVVQAQAQGFDLILMDCEMPIMDGYSATKIIRLRERQYDLPAQPIYALTAHALDEHVEECLNAGMNGHIAKPFRLENILEVLTLLTENK